MEQLIREIHKKIITLERDIRHIKEHLAISAYEDTSLEDGGEMGKILAGGFTIDKNVFKDVQMKGI
jgi:hypothetical protein